MNRFAALNADQRRVAWGIAAALGVTVTALGLTLDSHSVSATSAARLAVWAMASVVVASWVLVAVARLAQHRFATPADLDAAASTSEATARARRLQAILQNTLEQAFLAVVAYAAWTALTVGQDDVLLACAGLFSVGRSAFFTGYASGARSRAFGFALTFLPTCGLYLLLLWETALRALNMIVGYP